MKSRFVIFVSLLALLQGVIAQTTNELPFHKWALTPPMGWNSWDCFGPSVVEDEVKANADYMAANLKESGWEYIVVDIRWYVDNQTTGHYNAYDKSDFIIDEYGRYMPSPTRFPSAANGAGFKPLADYVHSLGLKFGIHIMRGVPKEAVFNNMPIKGSSYKASDIYSTAYECTWLQDNYTIESDKPGAQYYYNSIFDLYAEWGVDYIKIDDLSRPYHDKEIEMIRKGIDQTGRPMVLSMSPGATPLSEHDHARTHANLWRTIDDFWDNWAQLNYSFGVCADWAPYITPGAFPDADMLPLGKFIRGERAHDRYTNFTKDEQYTLMSLWAMFKSPLMFGGNMPDNDQFTLDLITNDEMLYINQHSHKNQEWSNEGGIITWTAEDPANGDLFVALFNNGGDGFVKTQNLLYRSGTVSRLTDGFGEDIDIELPEGADQLFLIVNDGGDGHACDHANWINPTVELADGSTVELTDLNWEYATSGWGNVSKNKSISGGKLNVKGTEYEKGIGTHSQSIVLFKLPENSVRFKTFAGLDLGGTNQTGGATVEFMIATEDPTPREVEVNNAIANTGRISRTLFPEGKKIEADITGAKKLYLVLTDAGDDLTFDHADWINPTIINKKGKSLPLTKLDWAKATSGWGNVSKNKSLDGNPLSVNGKTYKNGFGVNAYSIIEFDLPKGYTKFEAFCGIDDEVLNVEKGATVEFMVFTEDPSVLSSIPVTLDLNKFGFSVPCTIRDVWKKSDIGTYRGDEFTPEIRTHGVGLYRISPVKKK
ncbi:NPCBM/NEW2 domain-containing protein [Carboxylicivirga linearis]|uniref:Alpha-galactosidase n=1 Tax=Carboxylicivirga linearis TaxID=1628157 RepID=A0ABS5JTG5_9BACT|nr:NPCBM/NEW2 domain-containing protein [Carboxylicivirga linearis]MBS2098158.1 NPCBM/NEW2 domain-containing protein [Carboxylicivirga linearis]